MSLFSRSTAEGAASPRPLGLYIHIPFCRAKCAYCDFYSLKCAEGEMDAYAAALTRQLKEYAPWCKGYAVDTVYFGGGTPSYFGAGRLSELLGVIRRHYAVTKDAEITFEANPDSARDVKDLKRLKRAGFNRVSLGMQSSDAALLKAIGRIHSPAETEEAVTAARKAGFSNLSLDLIYGLPGQSREQWARDLAAALALQPEHLSCYGLKIEPGTPLHARRDTLDLPDDDAQADMYLTAVKTLKEAGFAQYEISNFAKPGRESRHNLKYWRLEEYLGFGPGAHSDSGGVRFAWPRDLQGYIATAGTPALLPSERDEIPPADRDSEYLMLGLRTAEGISKRVYERRFFRPFAVLEPFLRRCAAAGYALEPESGHWRLTPQGFLVSNQIIGELLDVMNADKLRRVEADEKHDYRMFIPEGK